MATPFAGTPGPKLIRLKALPGALLDLHKTLMESEKEAYEKVFGKVSSSGEYLRLVLEDPWFSWLRELSGLMARLDERLEAEEPVSESEAARWLDQTRGLLTPAEKPGSFAEEYREALQRDPDVVLAHAAVLKVVHP